MTLAALMLAAAVSTTPTVAPTPARPALPEVRCVTRTVENGTNYATCCFFWRDGVAGTGAWLPIGCAR